MNTQIVLLPPQGTGFRVELCVDDQRLARSLEFVYAPDIRASVKLAKPFAVPVALLKDDNGVTRLKTLPEIRIELANAATGALQELEDHWGEFVERASTAELSLDVDHKFLKALIWPAGAATVAGRANFNLGVCLSGGQPGAVFQGSLELAGEMAFDSVGVTAWISVACRVLMQTGVRWPKLAMRLPALGIDFPEFDLPSFSWPSKLQIPTPDFGFQLPSLPGIPFGIKHGPASLFADYDAGTEALEVVAKVEQVEVTAFGTNAASLGDLEFALKDGKVTMKPFTVVPKAITWTAQAPKPLPFPLDHLTLGVGDGKLRLAFDVGNRLRWKGYLETVLTVYPAAEPTKRIVLDLKLPFEGDSLVDSVDIGGPLPREIQLLKPTAGQLADALIGYLPSVGGLGIRLRMPKASLPKADALVDVLSAILGAIGRGVAGLARVIQSVLESIFQMLRQAASALGDLEVLLVVDIRTAQLLQVVVSLRHAKSAEPYSFEAAGFELTIPQSADLALLIDLRDGALDAYAVITVDKEDQLLKLDTDLWFSGPQLERPAGELVDADQPKKDKPKKLIGVKAQAKNAGRLSLVPIGLRHGQATFLHALKKPLPPIGQAKFEFEGYELTPMMDQVTVKALFPEVSELKKRLLPFLASPSADAPSGDEEDGVGQWLKQYIEIEKFDATEVELKDGRFEAAMGVVLHVMGSDIRSTLQLQVDARKMTAGIGGGLLKISLPKDGDKPFEFLGMRMSFSKDDKPIYQDQFCLDMRTRDTRMYLSEGVTATLEFMQLGVDASGRALKFEVQKFVVHGGGLDLDGKLRDPYRLKLNGLETDFTFKAAAVKVRSGRAESFRLEAKGKLPPDLLGNVDVGLRLEFGMKGDRLGLIDGNLELESKGKAIRSEQTHFDLTLEHLNVRAFEDGGSLHFCAFVTGSAVFKPTVSELADGMLKKLSGVELRFTDCPLAGASEVIRRELKKLNLSFVVALDEPIRANLFDLFEFEVRSIGFEPRCNLFDDRPAALIIGGQVAFADMGDVIRAECDFHQLYIAPGLGTLVPRVRCEGLGLALRIGGAIEVEGKVVAVDGRMPPDVLVSKKPDLSLEANGFMGQGRVAIPGFPPFAASFGFVEIKKDHWPAPRRAWFVYLEAQRLSYQFQLGPIPFYLREAGLGLGYHFTYVGIKAIDEAPNLPSVIEELDKIALNALEPAKLETWELSEDSGLTLVARVMFSMSSASTPVETLVWKETEESKLPNLMLLNAVVAMRNSTYMMTASAWLGYSYYDWEKNRQIGPNKLTGKQALTGYIILAGARSEFLARLISNPGAEIGSRLALPDAVKEGLRDFQYEATLYMRPGLLHFELGWPNRIRWTKNIGGATLSVIGGAIFRVHDGALLAGLNLEGVLTMELSGRLDAGVVGVAVQASVYAAIAARIIGYLDSQSASNSLYYSLFSLQVRVELQISAWLEIDAWLCKITVRISLAMTLQIDVLAELAVQGDGQVGAKMRATISVLVFGRSLGLSVGLGMNAGLVDRSAARVGRFMNLGLVQDTPSAVAPIGTQDAANEEAVKTGDARREARQAAAAANAKGTTLAKVPQDEPVAPGFEVKPIVEAREIGATNFQMVLSYPTVAPQLAAGEVIKPSDWVYITFLPLDSEPEKSSFYAAPRLTDADVAWDHRIELDSIPVDMQALHFYVFDRAVWQKRSIGSADYSVESNVEWAALLQYTQRNDNVDVAPRDETGCASMGQLFFATFRTVAETPADVNRTRPYCEPKAKPPLFKPEQSPASSNQDRFTRQEIGYLGAIKENPADRRCHEARDFLLHKFASDLFELAADGVVPETAHIVRLGLTLLVPLEFAEALGKADGPYVQVRKRVDTLPAVSQPLSDVCPVFNPPWLRFSEKRHKFIDPSAALEERVAKLTWLLHWDWDATKGERPAEEYVKHYRIVRTLSIDGTPITSPAITVACAVGEEWTRDLDGKPCRVLHPSPCRYTDEFDDLSSYFKAQLLNSALDVSVRYSVTPVCVSDTDGVVCSNFIASRKGINKLARPLEASVTLVLDPFEATSPDATEKLGNRVNSCRLVLSLTADPKDLPSVPVNRPKGDLFHWRIVARTEAILPAGDYGSDAQTQQALSSKLGAGMSHLPGDLWFDIPSTDELKFETPGGNDEENLPAELVRLQRLMQDVADPRAWTLLVQSVVKRGGAVVARSPLIQLKMAVQLRRKGSNDAGLITQVHALELVRLPFTDEREVLRPVAGEDLFVLPGRAVLPEPIAESASADIDCTLNVHPEFGAASRLSWNLRPYAASGKAARKYRMLSGFDVYALNLDTGLNPRESDSWLAAQRRTSVRLLGADRVTLTPDELGEPSNWKMRYPSQTARREAGGAWYSEAESYILWPNSPVRLHPLLEPASELIKALVSQGNPQFIELRMTRPDGLPPPSKEMPVVSWEFSLEAGTAHDWKVEGRRLSGGSATGLRAALRALQVVPVTPVKTAEWSFEVRSGWIMELQPLWEELKPEAKDKVELTEADKFRDSGPVETVAMHFERDLHPLIETILARMRRKVVADGEESLLEVDRRPAPVLKAINPGEFLALTGEAADPYGWVALDRLGLGVTIRLFDTYENRFLAPRQLREQLMRAVDSAKLLYLEDQKHLFVEYLLEPGAMTQRVDFAQLSDDSGRLTLGEHDVPIEGQALAMVRLSLRPTIEKYLNYRLFELKGGEGGGPLEDKTPLVDVILLSDGQQRNLADRSLAQLLATLDPKVPQIIVSRGEAIQLDSKADNEPGKHAGAELADAFSRFEPWKGWKNWDKTNLTTANSLNRFWIVLRNALRLGESDLALNLETIQTQWLPWNKRFFDYAAVPTSPGALPQYAVGAIEQTEPVRAAADTSGQISTVLAEPDGYAHRRAFAVLPQWRYGRILEAFAQQLTPADRKNEAFRSAIAQQLTPSVRKDIVLAAANEHPRQAISSIERTAPVLPQAAYPLGRVGDVSWWRKGDDLVSAADPGQEAKLGKQAFMRLGSMPGRSLAIALPHHPEQLLSEDNLTVARNLSRYGLQSTFVLTAVDPAWTGEYADEHVLKPIHEDTTALPLAADLSSMLGRRERSGMSNAQSKVRLVRFLPHWYRHGIVVTASAGKAVSQAMATYLPDAPCSLVNVVNGEIGVKSTHPWRSMLDAGIVALPVDDQGDANSARFLITLPALRYVDCTDEDTARLWPDAFSTLPDPEVAYDLEFESEATPLRPQKVVKAVARISRSGDASPGNLKFKVLMLDKDLDVKCRLLMDDVKANHKLEISVSPLSTPVIVSAALQKALAGSPHLTGDTLRVPGGWSDDWLARLVSALDGTGPSRAMLVRDLWQALAAASVGLAAPAGPAFEQFPKYSLKEFKLSKPTAKELAETLAEWLKALEGSKTIVKALGGTYAGLLEPLLKGDWPYGAGDHTEILPWIEDMPQPGALVSVGPAAGSSPRHLLPELMTTGEYEHAKNAVDPSELPCVEQLWAAQKERAWVGGKLAIRATRGDLIPLQLPLISQQ